VLIESIFLLKCHDFTPVLYLLAITSRAEHSFHKKREGRVEDIGEVYGMSCVGKAAGEIHTTILFFEDLINDAVDHCRILDQ